MTFRVCPEELLAHSSTSSSHSVNRSSVSFLGACSGMEIFPSTSPLSNQSETLVLFFSGSNLGPLVKMPFRGFFFFFGSSITQEFSLSAEQTHFRCLLGRSAKSDNSDRSFAFLRQVVLGEAPGRSFPCLQTFLLK